MPCPKLRLIAPNVGSLKNFLRGEEDFSQRGFARPNAKHFASYAMKYFGKVWLYVDMWKS